MTLPLFVLAIALGSSLLVDILKNVAFAANGC